MKFRNLTPHSINILNQNKELVKTIQSTGLARCNISKQKLYEVDGVILYETIFGEVEGLPKLKKGIINIVSLVVRQALSERGDLYSPGKLVRDNEGKPIGCIGLTR